MPIVVSPYDPAWPEHFELLRARVWPAVQPWATAMEHVGSTSVPGLAAKPVIDADVIVADADALAHCIDALAPLGWTHLGERGIVGRHAFTRVPDLPPHNLYVCLAGSLGLRNHLILRDHLRAHAEDARAYGALKRALAGQASDMDAYVEGKTAFIVAILRQYDVDADALDQVIASNLAPPR